MKIWIILSKICYRVYTLSNMKMKIIKNNLKWKVFIKSILFCFKSIIEAEITEASKGNYSYKEISDISDITEESIPDHMKGKINEAIKDLENYDRLMEMT